MSLRVHRCGTSGPLLIFVHGWGFTGSVWESVMARLEASYRCLAVDLPGFGSSPPLECEYSLRNIAGKLAADLPPDARWIGWSLGSLVAMQVAIDHPSSVGSLVLVAGTPRFIRGNDWPQALDARLLDSFGRDLLQHYDQTLSRFIMLQVQGSSGARDVARSLRHGLRQAPRPRSEVLAAGLRLLRETDLRRSLSAISCPVTVLLGERDTLVPLGVGKDLQTLCPDWHIEIMPGAGHAPFLSNPELFCDRLTRASHVSA